MSRVPSPAAENPGWLLFIGIPRSANRGCSADRKIPGASPKVHRTFQPPKKGTKLSGPLGCTLALSFPIYTMKKWLQRLECPFLLRHHIRVQHPGHPAEGTGRELSSGPGPPAPARWRLGLRTSETPQRARARPVRLAVPGPPSRRRPRLRVPGAPRGRTLTLRRPRAAAAAGRGGRRQQQRQEQRQQRPGRPGATAARDPHTRRGGCGRRRRSAGGERGGGSGRCVRAPCPPPLTPPARPRPAPEPRPHFHTVLPRPGRAARGQCRPSPRPWRRGRLSARRCPAAPAPCRARPREPCAPPARSALQLDPVPPARTDGTWSLKYADRGHPERILCSSEPYSPQTPKPPMGLSHLST